MPKLSIGSWAFTSGPSIHEPWDFNRILEYTSNAGYDGIELLGSRPYPGPQEQDTPAKCRELLKRIGSHGLGISGYVPDLGGAHPFLSGRGAYLEALTKVLDFCEHCQIPLLRVDTASAPQEVSPEEYEEHFSVLSSNWRSAAREAEKRGVILVWEFEPAVWLNKPTEVKRLLDAVGHPCFKLLFDTSHAYMGAVMGARQVGTPEILPGGVGEYARMVSGYMGHLHLIDCDGTLYNHATSTHTPFGQGKVDFAGSLAPVREKVLNLPWWCLDFFDCVDVEQAGRDAVPYVKRLRKELEG